MCATIGKIICKSKTHSYFYSMIYCIDPTADEPILLINKHIGYDADSVDEKGNLVLGDGMGIDGSIFQHELLELDNLGKKRIQVWINSYGGVVMDGYNIYSAILKSKTPVDTYAVGGVASIAAVIFQAGRKRIMADYGWLMYHNPFGSSNQDILKTMKDSLIKMIEQRCGMSEVDVTQMMNRTTYISASEAQQMKLCDQIDASSSENTKYLRKIDNQAEFHSQCNLVLNSILNKDSKINNKMENFTKVTMRLRLNDSAPADDVVKAIDAIENRATNAETAREKAILDAQDKAKADSEEIASLKAKFEKKQAEADKLKADYEEAQNKLDAMTQDKLAVEEAAKEEVIKNMVTEFAKAGRIKNDASTILEWTSTAKLIGVDKAKNMIEALPLNKVAVKIETELNVVPEGELPTTAMGLAVKNKLRREGKL